MQSKSKKQVFPCCLKILSPVHIGCDEVYEPTGFAVDETQQRMVVFDPLLLMRSLSAGDKARFARLCKKGTLASILEIYKFMHNRPIAGQPVKVCAGFIEHYKTMMKTSLNDEVEIRNKMNKFLIPRTAFNANDQRPYLPGSSIKGALRTAYLNHQEKIKNIPRQRNANQLEEKLLNYRGVPSDPFRLVEVSDFKPVGDAPTRIIYGINQKKKVTQKQARGLPLLFEVIQPGALFEGVITVEQPLPGAGVNEPVDLKTLLNSAAQFYLHEKQREEDELKPIGITPLVDAPPKGAGIIRCGRHSGAEAVTVQGHRDIRIMLGGGKKKFLDHATTIWLASETKQLNPQKAPPFGWVQFSRLDKKDADAFTAAEQQWREREAHKQKERLDAIEKERLAQKAAAAKAARESARQAEVQARLEKAESERQAAWDAMTPDEKKLAEELAIFDEETVSLEKVNTLYKRLDEFSPVNQIAIAKKLKEYWSDNRQWTKKDVGNKKWKNKVRAKVNQIESILKGAAE